MSYEIKASSKRYKFIFVVFGLVSLFFMIYYLSDTIIHFTTPRQFPVNSFARFPLSILIFPAEAFSFLFALYFVYTILTDKNIEEKKLKKGQNVPVAVLLPVYQEPKHIIERTLIACSKLRWENEVVIYILDDSKEEKYKKEVDELARKFKTRVVRRKTREGYKAGNINNAVKNEISEDYFVVFDSDQAPKPDFLERMIPYFEEDNVGFVQSPQHFINDNSLLQRASKMGTNIFYRAQSVSKSKDNSIPFCGTNLVVKTEVFRKVGGFAYYTATEDIDLGIRMNAAGFKGAYVPRILAEGYAPEDFNAYKSQQYRWANGNLAILRENWFRLFGGNFPFRYQMHMFFTVGWWLIGVVTLVYVLVPILSILFGFATHHTWLPSVLLFFLFFHVVLGITMIYASLRNRIDGEKMEIRDALLQYSLITNSIFIYARAAFNAMVLKRYVGFIRTDKIGSHSKLRLVKWNLVVAFVTFVLSLYGLYRTAIAGDFQQVRSNFPLSLWLFFYSVVFASSILFVGKVGGKND